MSRGMNERMERKSGNGSRRRGERWRGEEVKEGTEKKEARSK